MFSALFWIALGMTIGWAAAITRDERELRRTNPYLIIGGIGGMVGGFLGDLLDTTHADYSTITADIMFAVFGSIALLLISNFAIQFLQKTR